MLVDQGAGQVEVAPVEHDARACEAQGQRDTFRHRHAAKEHGHRKRRDLAFAQAAVMDAAHDEGDLLDRQLLAVALPANDFLWQHPGGQA